ncbi:TetR/AcrR family transcriptional regulator [Microbacterium sp.]|uniref:TetR/AcrR family transcriptional regulator n=1 Tax=Microbacterium sp. TaxID=51671 RepID=UPI002BB1F7FB|nr:TetR/AcrR family transcriptional regulator [Microbacterium sp.]HWK77477.1 TetR/AcrR family transcriptional regulator [Microbacterium sp.]
MARPPRARERVLDAFEAILIEEGERAATLDATAAAAGVSKGGLLYHFASKDDLAEGMIDRLQRLVAEDLIEMAAAPDGPVAFYVRTSVMENAPLDRALIAVSRLAQGGSSDAAVALRTTRRSWGDAMRPHVRDETALDLVLLVSDGLYFNNSLDVSGPDRLVPRGEALRALVDLVVRTAT